MDFIYATSQSNIHLNSPLPACWEILKCKFGYLMVPKSWKNWKYSVFLDMPGAWTNNSWDQK